MFGNKHDGKQGSGVNLREQEKKLGSWNRSISSWSPVSSCRDCRQTALWFMLVKRTKKQR